MDSVAKVADDIIPKGIITYTEDKKGKRNTYIQKMAN